MPAGMMYKYTPKRGKKGPAAKKGSSLSSRVRTLEASRELKYREKTATANLSIVGRVDPLTEIAEGSTSLTRDGLKIKPHSLLLNYRLQHSSDENAASQSNDPKPQCVRVMVVVDRQQLGDASPSASTVLGAVSDFYLSGLNRLTAVNRFSVIYDKRHILNWNNLAVGVSKYIDLTKKVKMVGYNGTATTDIQKNGIYVIAGCAEDAGTSYNNPVYDLMARLRYSDT